MKLPLRTLTAILVLGGSTAFYSAGCSSTPMRKSTGEMIDDATITTKVKAAFVKDPVVKALEVKVDTFKGNVQLNGFVDTAEEKALAERIARGIEGVVDVQNAIALKAQTPR